MTQVWVVVFHAPLGDLDWWAYSAAFASRDEAEAYQRQHAVQPYEHAYQIFGPIPFGLAAAGK